ncbi:Retrovirus-related Pol polyprotein from transposon RE2 [Vitis vinifera]|uniref:Retrovirus-related Pol polyprotein from transposon RE2 n=1 Tax=Vitis vinifera TaxID=29760 RepID=A0A438HN51_VITVI|nr:Retrovirus-related Pol polyprotein from transposon RE2 [Vitis vinifera]
MITSEKLVGSENYLSWSASVELWFMGQGYEDHLVTQEADIPEVDRVQWRKIDAQLCSVLWQSVDPKILLHLRAYKTCFKFWNQAKGLYTNDIQRLYKIDKFFMVLTLIGLRPDLETVRDQILGSSSVPSLDDVFARLLRISSTQTLPSDNTSDSSVLVSQTNSRGGRSGNRGRGQRPHCTYCNKLGHTRDRWYFLTDSEYDDYLRYQATKSASVAQTGNASACLTHTSSLGPWILDSGASDHISGPEYGEDDWHRTRLGHPSLSKFQKMVPSFSSLSSLACESCQLGKHTRVSFPKRLNNRAKSPFELVHTDVWGPCRTASTLGFQYFVTFIDDYSRSERKNRHLVETARTLLLHSHVPFRFWGDAVLTACYLINCMPSSVLHDQIPHSLLFPDQPLYFLPPRVFGCTCFVHILTPGQDKLLPEPQNASSWDIPDFKRVIVVIPLRLIATFSPRLPSRPLQVYHRRHRVVFLLLWRGNRSTRNPHPIYNFLSYHRLSSPYSAFVSAISSVSLPKSTPEALSHPGWRQAMVDEMAALHSNGTWDLVVLPSGKSTVGCRWVYTVKVGPDGQVDRLKARLVAKGYTQVYGSDYGDTFSPVAKIASVRLLLSMAAMRSWPLYQLDIKNAFLHGDLAEEVYMEQPPGFVAQGESGLVCRLRRSLYGLKQSPRAWFSRFSSVVQEFGMFRSTADHSVFYHHNSSGQCIYLTKDLGKLKYFLGIEIAQSSSGVVLSQRKYALDILEETGMLDCKPVDTPMDPNVKLIPGQGGAFRRSWEISATCSHWDAVIRILRYIKSTPGQGVLYENRGHTQLLVTQMQIGLAHPQIDVPLPAEYRAMALATCELIWLKHLLRELRFGKDEQMKLICDNQAALHIASNPVFHERTKHIEVDCHFIREKIASGCVATSFVNSNDQLADIFTKSLRGLSVLLLSPEEKSGAWGRVRFRLPWGFHWRVDQPPAFRNMWSLPGKEVPGKFRRKRLPAWWRSDGDEVVRGGSGRE